MAEEDLEDGAEALKRKRWFRTAFYAQQAAEKAFKALFFPGRREDPPHGNRTLQPTQRSKL